MSNRNPLTALLVNVDKFMESIIIPEIEALLQSGHDPSKIDDYKQNAVHMIAQKGLLEVLQVVIRYVKNKADISILVNIPSGSNLPQTPLMLAAENGHFDCVKLLIEYGAKITSASIKYPLWRGWPFIADYLIDLVLNDPQYDKYQIIDATIVEAIASVNRTDILMKLVRYRIRLDPYILYTAVYGRHKMATWLIQIGCPADCETVHSKLTYHYSSLRKAIQLCNQDLVYQLIEAGAKMFDDDASFMLNDVYVTHQLKETIKDIAEKYGIDIYSRSHIPTLITLCLRVINFGTSPTGGPLVDIPPWFPPILYTGNL